MLTMEVVVVSWPMWLRFFCKGKIQVCNSNNNNDDDDDDDDDDDADLQNGDGDDGVGAAAGGVHVGGRHRAVDGALRHQRADLLVVVHPRRLQTFGCRVFKKKSTNLFQKWLFPLNI